MKMVGLPLVAAPTRPERTPSHTAGLEAWCEFRPQTSTDSAYLPNEAQMTARFRLQYGQNWAAYHPSARVSKSSGQATQWRQPSCIRRPDSCLV
jgi:hypothetical protein